MGRRAGPAGQVEADAILQGGPMHGHGFFEETWREYQATAARIQEASGRRPPALDYEIDRVTGQWTWRGRPDAQAR